MGRTVAVLKSLDALLRRQEPCQQLGAENGGLLPLLPLCCCFLLSAPSPSLRKTARPWDPIPPASPVGSGPGDQALSSSPTETAACSLQP